jgi:hypothetical protein
MKFDIVLAGVGGQGVLSLSSIIAAGALDAGLHVKQSEVHGMAQRGGSVTAHLRLSDHPVESELVPVGAASMVLSLEPVEALRYLHYLAPGGAVVTAASEPVINVPGLPAPRDAARDDPRPAARRGGCRGARAPGGAGAGDEHGHGRRRRADAARAGRGHRAVHPRAVRPQGGDGHRSEPRGVPRGAGGVGMHGDLIAGRWRSAAPRPARTGVARCSKPEAFELLAACGLRVPRRLFVSAGSREAGALDLGALGSARVVVKVVAPGSRTRATSGGRGVRRRDARGGGRRHRAHGVQHSAGQDVAGYSVSEHVAFDPSSAASGCSACGGWRSTGRC